MPYGRNLVNLDEFCVNFCTKLYLQRIISISLYGECARRETLTADEWMGRESQTDSVPDVTQLQ